MNVLEIVISGLAGAALMSVLMTIIHESKWANADMIRALGSFVTRRYENALLPGLLIHSVSGIVFAFPYAFVLNLVDLHSVVALTLIGGLVGLVHGFVMSFILLMVVSERHPLETFRDASIQVAIAHIVGHIGYGVGVGAVFGFFNR